jgi:hypothetical protein
MGFFHFTETLPHLLLFLSTLSLPSTVSSPDPNRCSSRRVSSTNSHFHRTPVPRQIWRRTPVPSSFSVVFKLVVVVSFGDLPVQSLPNYVVLVLQCRRVGEQVPLWPRARSEEGVASPSFPCTSWELVTSLVIGEIPALDSVLRVRPASARHPP